MKSKRVLSLAFFMLIAMVVSFFPIMTTQTYAAVEIKKAVGYSYDLEYILKDAGFVALQDQSTIKGGREIEYKLSTETDFIEATSTIEFKKVAKYDFKVSIAGVEESSFVVDAVANSDITEDSLYYSFDDTLILNYNSNINTILNPSAGGGTPLQVGDSFTVPTLEKLCGSLFFDYSTLTKTIYYASPQSTSYSSTTSSKFTLSYPGVYTYYVLLSDEAGNKMSVDDLVKGPGGWYEKDDDDNRIGDVIIPIFTFTMHNVVGPKISVGTSENGFIGLTYSINCFTIVSTSYDTEYTLWYSEHFFDKDDEKYADDSEFIAEVLANSTEIVDEEIFDKDALSFDPDKKGFYYVLIRVVDSANMGDEAMSRAISVQSEYIELPLVNEFIKNNLTSVIFLSISLASFVAIIVLLCIKPKDPNDLDLELKSIK